VSPKPWHRPRRPGRGQLSDVSGSVRLVAGSGHPALSADSGGWRSALAISRSEAATVKQIDQMGLLIQTGSKTVDDKFSDIKDRLTRIEGKGEGSAATVVTHGNSSRFAVAVISALIAARWSGRVDNIPGAEALGARPLVWEGSGP
jgi:hypothetical protein